MGILKIILRVIFFALGALFIIRGIITFIDACQKYGTGIFDIPITGTRDIYLIIGFITLFLIAVMVLVLLLMLISWTFSND